jgi:hypothetical protein
MSESALDCGSLLPLSLRQWTLELKFRCVSSKSLPISQTRVAVERSVGCLEARNGRLEAPEGRSNTAQADGLGLGYISRIEEALNRVRQVTSARFGPESTVEWGGLIQGMKVECILR